jgi:NAD(P)-dependent dehydrogenase (short-subunit alcohol dehydrogenase family)
MSVDPTTIAIVTGGAAGIGAGISLRLLAGGYCVVAADWNQDHLNGLEASVDSGRERLLLQRTDVSQPDEVEACVQACVEAFGMPGVLVNNAGLTFDATGGVLDLSVEQWRRILSVNLDGAFYFSRAVASRMVEARIPGRVVHIGSVNSLAAEKLSAAYCASKGGLLMLAKSMAVDLGPHGILVNCVAPGAIEHEGTAAYHSQGSTRGFLEKTIPVGRPGSTAEIAEAVAFLVSQKNTYITGACLVVDGGMTSYLRTE